MNISDNQKKETTVDLSKPHIVSPENGWVQWGDWSIHVPSLLTHSSLGNSSLAKSAINPEGSTINTSTLEVKLGDSWVKLGESKVKDSMLGWANESSVVDIRREISLGSSTVDVELTQVDGQPTFMSGIYTSWIATPDKLKTSWVEVPNVPTTIVTTTLAEREAKDLTANPKTSNILIKLHLAATLMQGIVDGTVKVATHWDKIVCGLSGVLGGAAQMVSFNPINIGLGAVRLAAGVNVMWNVYDGLTPTEVQHMVRDSKASVDAIRLLAKSNEESLNRVSQSLAEAKRQSEGIQSHLKEIIDIKENGNKTIQILKLRALEDNAKVQGCLEATQAKFAEANKMAIESQKGFDEVILCLNMMISLFSIKEGTSESKIQVLAELTAKIAALAEDAYTKMNDAQQLRAEGDALLSKLSNIQIAAAQSYGIALGAATGVIEAIAQEAKVAEVKAQVVANEIEQAQEVILDVKGRNDDIHQIAIEVVEELGLLENVVSDNNSMLRMFACAAGAIAFSSVIGSVPTILLTVAAVKYSHALANGLTSWLARKVVKENKPMAVNDQISYQFNALSTSFVDRLRRKACQTAGMLSIQIGKQAMKMEFNFNRNNILNINDLRKFSEVVLSEVTLGNITKQDALKLINDLKNCEIERKGQGRFGRNIIQTGFIVQNEVRLNELERKLGKVIAINNEAAVEKISDEENAYLDMKARVFLF